MEFVRIPGVSALRKLSRRYKLRHRHKGYEFLSGRGLEIGALHIPARLPPRCTVDYCDIMPKIEALKLFPELVNESIVDATFLCDLDKEGLYLFHDNTFDFVILNHVIEHIANPIKAIKEIFRVTRGLVVISAPDKHFTFDKPRQLTPFDHLMTEYTNNITSVSDDHYIDLLRAINPDAFNHGEKALQDAIDQQRVRREHAHVWSSESFKKFLLASLDALDLSAACLYESMGTDNKLEYFSVWTKRSS